MIRFSRTVSAVALALGLAGGVSLVPGLVTPVAHAQESAETRFRSMLDMLGLPLELVKWSGVEEAGNGLIVRGFSVDVSRFNMGLTSFPLGDWEITALESDGTHVTKIESRFTNISIDLAELMTTGQKLGQAGAQYATLGSGLAMLAGQIQGLGYKTLEMSIGYDYAVDLGEETLGAAIDFDVKDAFRIAVDAGLTGVSAQYLDWSKANMTKMYFDQSPESVEAMQKELQDPNSPLAKLGYKRFAFAFDDQGLMPKLEPQLAMARSMMLGTNPDGTAKTAVSDEDITKAAGEMAAGSGISAEKLEPVVRALYNFVMTPDVLHLAVAFDPAVTAAEFLPMMPSPDGAPKQLPPDGEAPEIDWNSRISLEASN